VVELQRIDDEVKPVGQRLREGFGCRGRGGRGFQNCGHTCLLDVRLRAGLQMRRWRCGHTLMRKVLSACRDYHSAALFWPLTAVNFRKTRPQGKPDARTVIPVTSHPERNVIRVQLKQNEVLKDLSDADRAELESHLVIVEGNKGDFLLHQGVREME